MSSILSLCGQRALPLGTALLSIGLLLIGFAGPAAGHEITPSIVTITLHENHRADVVIRTNLEAVLADIGSEHEDTDEAPGAALYNRLRSLPPAELQAEVKTQSAELTALIALSFSGTAVSLPEPGVDIPEVGDPRVARNSQIRYQLRVPFDAAELSWQSAARLGDVVLKVENSDGQKAASQWLKNGAASAPISLSGVLEPATSAEVFVAYLVLGFEHIVPKGLDHILFVLGLFLLSTQWRPLLYQVTAFTVAHTITLALAIYELVELSPVIVEPLIALSIVYVAVENILKPGLKPSRIGLVFAFGLLHGLGFAGVLHELGLPADEYLTALISFNIGVELGQLAVIVGALLLFGLWFSSQPWYRKAIVIPGSATIGAVGLWWFLERTVM